MAKKIGTLIKEARTGAGLTQEALAKKITGVSASDISKAERGETEFSQDVLKKIAKACGVTQASLLNAAKEPAKKTTTKKIVSAKKTTADKDEEKKSTAKKTTTKKTAASDSTMKLTAAEKKLVQLYRDADSDTKKEVLKLLSPEEESDDNPLLDVLGDILGGLLK
ncbi:MAG: helix-turn-helix transcriptional regulator [Clostridia bacterium]|nr:helix-turn-helix transcriptional regulator [Clostridia bacterium]